MTRLSRRAIRLSINWQAPVLLDPTERERSGARGADATLSTVGVPEHTRVRADLHGKEDACVLPAGIP